MKIWKAILVACLFLSGCTDSETKQEDKLIKDYEFYIGKAMSNHSKNVAVARSIEETYKHHVLLLKDLSKIKDSFSAFTGKDRLHKTIEIYHDSLSYFVIRQVQIIELGMPIWLNDINLLGKLKDETFYQQHQVLLSGLLSMIDEFEDLMMTHHETIRLKIVSSGLSQQERQKHWTFFERVSSENLKVMSVTLKSIKIRAEGQVEIAQFLYENKNDYKIDPEEGLVFSSKALTIKYDMRVNSMTRRLNSEKMYGGASR